MKNFLVMRRSGFYTWYLKLGSGFDGSLYWMCKKEDAQIFSEDKANALLTALPIVFGFKIFLEEIT